MAEIWAWTATETAMRVAKGDVSARDVAQSVLDRVSVVEPKLNALSEVTESIALEAADAVDAARGRGAALGPLAGVPITIKNNVDQQSTYNTGGIAAARDVIAQEDSPLVARLKAAGAVIVGRTNVPAFSFRWFTDTVLHGRTLNPHDAALSPGGSSGGAGVAVASGMGAIAHGNDIGGSIRHPAHMNGVVGLRPTVGRVPSYVGSGDGVRMMASQMITTEGPLARSVSDMALSVNAMAGQDVMDPQSVPVPAVENGVLPERVGVFASSTLGAPAEDVCHALARASDALRGAGCRVEPIVLPRFEEAHAIWMALVGQGVRHHLADEIRASGDDAVIHKVESMLQLSEELSAGHALDLWEGRLQIMRAWSQVFAGWPVILMPVSYRHALKVDADQGNLASVERLFADQSPLLATALTGVPGLAVPTGLAGDGAPTGVQLIGRWWDEATLLAAGAAIEARCPPVVPVQAA